METIKWTEEQSAAIEDRGNNLLVSASAGSGKTFTMTKRIVDLVIKEKVPITNFLIVTFTKTSADDMKKKIVNKLMECEQSDFVLEQIDAVATSDISDLHSFYSRLVSSYFYEIQVDPNYHIVDELESHYFKNRALDLLIEKKEKEDDADFFEVLDIFSKNRQDSEFRQTIIKFSEYLDSHIDGKAWFDETLLASYNFDLNKNVCANHINSYVSLRVVSLAKEADEFAKICLEAGSEKYYNHFINLSSKIRAIKTSAGFLSNAKAAFEIVFDNLPVVAKEHQHLSEKAIFLNKKIKSEIENFKENFVSSDESELAFGMKKAKADVVKLFNLTIMFQEIYAKLKREVNGLDFNDLEKFAYKILQNKEILKTVKEKYRYIFVDEYQDINAVQEKIISMIAGENNLFLVGDLKQSIYRFRLCDPEIFLQKYRQYSSGKEFCRAIKLNSNFRSDKNILKFVDRVFSGVMTENFGEIDYAKESCFIAGENNYDRQNSANICFIDTAKEKSQEVWRNQVYSVKNHEQTVDIDTASIVCEAKLVASKIVEIMSEDKNATFSDFAVLVFSRNAKTAKFIEELNSLGIPISADDKYDMMSRNYIQELVNFAKLASFCVDDFLLFKVLKSKLFNFSDSELAEIRMLNKKLKFVDALSEYKNLKNANLISKIENFYNLLNKFKFYAGIYSISEMLKKIIEEFKLNEINLLLVDGVKINEEIDKFISRLPAKGVYEFFIEMGDFSFVHENECGGDAVSLMTVHKSKGIEFKYVFVINVQGKINFASARGKLLFNKNFGVGLNYFDSEKRTQKSCIPISWIRMIERRKIAEEQQRVLYVALTRAKEKLFVICSKNSETIQAEFPERPSAYINWFEPIIFSELSGKHDENLNFETYLISDFEGSCKKQIKQLLLNGKGNLNENNKPIEFKYGYESLANVPLKTSVSKILKISNFDIDDEYESRMEKLSEEFVKSSAERGTAYHKVFEKIDFFDLQNVEKQVSEILENLPKEYSDLILKEKILAVLSLPLFKNIAGKYRVIKEREFFAKVPSTLLGENRDGGEMILQGVVDLILVGKEELIILDYKTGKSSDEKLRSYNFQLNCYADAISRAFGRVVTQKLICFIDEQKLLEI